MLAEEMLECHECSAVCEKVLYPAACLSMNCRFLYSFQEDGRTYFGCIQKVFSHEVDLKRFQEIERTKGGFGVVKFPDRLAILADPAGAEPVELN